VVHPSNEEEMIEEKTATESICEPIEDLLNKQQPKNDGSVTKQILSWLIMTYVEDFTSSVSKDDSLFCIDTNQPSLNRTTFGKLLVQCFSSCKTNRIGSRGIKRVTLPTYCHCKSSHECDFMIQCDKCLIWYHGEYVNLNQSEAKDISEYFCNN